VQLKGWSWFYQSLIAGTTDCIWGGNRVSLFEDSEIRMLGDPRSSGPSGGYLVQARSAFVGDKGFVFLNSLLSHGPGASGTQVAIGNAAQSYLARSGGNASYFDNVSYINCRMDAHIPLVGWAEQPAPNPAEADATSGWKEYGSTDLEGNALDLSERSAAAHTLTTEEYQTGYASREVIFAEFGNGTGWSPEP
jgi:pectin methylesterase-like acyl-CoA thioesterase